LRSRTRRACRRRGRVRPGTPPDDITFPLAPLYERKGIRYINEAAARIDTDAHVVTTTSGEALPYDRLLIATGPRLAFEKVLGLGPEAGYTQSVCNPCDHALLSQNAWERFLEKLIARSAVTKRLFSRW